MKDGNNGRRTQIRSGRVVDLSVILRRRMVGIGLE